MSRYRHDGACTISHHYIICNIDRDFLSVNRIDTFKSLDSNTCFIFYKLSSLEFCLLCTLITICNDLVHVCNFVCIFVNDRMLRCDYHESYTKQGVRSGCINFKFLVDSVNIKINESTFGFTDPVDLLLFYIIRIIYIFQTFQKFICILSDS